MSKLGSLFDVLAGMTPQISRSALLYDLKQKDAEDPVLQEGMIAKIVAESGQPVFTKLTSANNGDTTIPDNAWLIIRGTESSDALTAKKLTGALIKTGIIFRVATQGAFTIGDYVYANAGVVTRVDANQQAIGQVIEVNSSAGYIVVAS